MAKRAIGTVEPANSREVPVVLFEQDERGVAFGFRERSELAFKVSGEIWRDLLKSARDQFEAHFGGQWDVLCVQPAENDRIRMVIVRKGTFVPATAGGREAEVLHGRAPASGRRAIAPPSRRVERLPK